MIVASSKAVRLQYYCSILIGGVWGKLYSYCNTMGETFKLWVLYGGNFSYSTTAVYCGATAQRRNSGIPSICCFFLYDLLLYILYDAAKNIEVVCIIV